MSTITVQGSHILLSSETSFIYHVVGTSDFKLVNLSNSASINKSDTQDGTNNITSRENNIEKDVKINFVCSAISSDNRLIAIQSPEKILLVYEIQTWEVIFKRQLARGASKILFTADDKYVIVGDKTGDVFLYDIYSEKKETSLLGHLSIVLDIIMSDDGKYIITCDRDEKIRVSNYPNCYNIENYCLGHRQFVTNVQFLPHNMKLLISCSGDGSLRLWDYIQGKAIHTYEFDNKDRSESSESQNQLKCFSSVQLNTTTSIVCVSIFKSNIIHVLLVKDETFELLNTITLDHEPVHLHLSSYTPESFEESANGHSSKEVNLWLIGQKVLQVFSWNSTDSSFVIATNEKVINSLAILNSQFSELAIDSNTESVIYVLQKRKMDEITDYFARKQARIDEKSKNCKNKY